jgi:hypothetical protein
MGGKFYVYEHWRLDRDECFYVGKGHGGRAYNMRHRNQHHKAIQAKVSRIGSAIEVRIVSSGLSEQSAFSLEIERIQFWENCGLDLANHTKGGTGTVGYKFTDSQKETLSNAVKEYFTDEGNRKKTAEATKKGMTPEVRAKLSQIKKNMPKEQRDHLSAIARNMPAEQRKKIAVKVKIANDSMTPEQKAIKSEKGRINALKRWNPAKSLLTAKES